MQFNEPAFLFDPNFNFGVQTPLVDQSSISSMPIPPAADFLLLDGTDFLLLDGTNFLLLGS